MVTTVIEEQLKIFFKGTTMLNPLSSIPWLFFIVLLNMYL